MSSSSVRRRKGPERVFDQTDVMQHRGVSVGGVAGQDLPYDVVVFQVGAHEATLDLELSAAKRADPA